MRIKPQIVAVIMAIMVLFSGGVAVAQTTDAQILALLQQISALQDQIKLLSQQQAWCYNFNEDFGVGAQGPNAKALVTALRDKEKIQFSSTNPLQDDAVSYDEDVAYGVTVFQGKYGIEQTGYVGLLTRKKLNELYACSGHSVVEQANPLANGPKVAITSPNGGESFYRNSAGALQIDIKWTSSNVAQTQKIDVIRLRANDTGREYGLAGNVLASEGHKLVAVPSSVPAGSYTAEIKAYTPEDVLLFDSSNSYFIIYNTAECISDADCPAANRCEDGKCISVQTANSWIKVGPPHTALNNCALECQKIGKACAETDTCPAFIAFYDRKSYTGGEKLMSNGNIPIHNGCSAKWGSLNSTSINYCCCTDALAQAPSIIVASPKGGETWKIGETRNITWSSAGMPSTGTVDINLINNTSGIAKNIASNIPINANFYAWQVDASSNTNYMVRVVANSSASVFGSSGYFTIEHGCTDSDKGQNYKVKGTTVRGDNSYTDSCQDSTRLVENYCASGAPASTVYTCPDGCLDGACLQATNCTDSDGGQVYNTKGITSDGLKNYADSCQDSTRLVENYCASGGPASAVYTCPNGCLNGACLAAMGCGDSDGGQLYNTKGTTSDGANSYADSCQDSTRLVENYCSFGKRASTIYSCPSGCLNGACIVSSQPVGPLAVSLSDLTPAAQKLISMQRNMIMAKIKLTNNSVLPITNINKIRVDSNSAEAFSKIYNIKIFDGAVQLGSTVPTLTNDSNFYALVYISRFAIPANGTKTLDLVADVVTNPLSGPISLGISELSCDAPGCTISGLPVYGNTMTVGSTAVGCTDSDGGQVYKTKGTTSDGTNRYTDSCLDSARLKENYCASGGPASAVYTCPSGCLNGVCISSQASPLCPANTTWNPVAMNAISITYPYGRGWCTGTPTCPSGTVWNATLLQAVSATYPYGRGTCAGSTPPCPASQNTYGNLCVAQATCPAGQSLNIEKNACTAQPTCPAAMTLDSIKNNACMAQPTCPADMTLDSKQNKCVSVLASALKQSSVASVSSALQNIYEQVKQLLGR